MAVVGSDLLRCGSDAAEELGTVLTAGGAAAAPSRCAGGDTAAFSLISDADVGLSWTPLQDDGGWAVQFF